MVCHPRHIHTQVIGHEAQDGEDDEASIDAGSTVGDTDDDAVPEGEKTGQFKRPGLLPFPQFRPVEDTRILKRKVSLTPCLSGPFKVSPGFLTLHPPHSPSLAGALLSAFTLEIQDPQDFKVMGAGGHWEAANCTGAQWPCGSRVRLGRGWGNGKPPGWGSRGGGSLTHR